MRSDQRSLGFRVGHCFMQLNGVDIYKQTHLTPPSVWVMRKATSPQPLRSKDLDTFTRLRRGENDQ